MPTPLHAHFEIPEDAKSSFPMIPDDDDDAATAMASVNPEMVVEMNMPGIVLPLFVEGAAPIGLVPGENLPFAYVNWETMQSAVLSPTGAQFSVIPVEIGANQVPIPIGDGVIVSCGPFECSESPMAPEISIANSAVCNDWDPTVEIQVGKVDNDVVEATADDGSTDTDGVDLGIVTSSSVAMKVTHVFSGVAKGTNSETSTDAAKGSDKALAMKAVSGVIVVDSDGGTPDDATDDTVACETTYDAGSITDRPEGCFRLIGPGAMGRANAKTGAPNGPDYLSGYSLELAAVGAGVSWGRVDWDPDPFKDLKCESVSMMVSDEVDICGMFEEEVDYAIGEGWSPEVVFNAAHRAVMWRAAAEKSGTNAADGGTEGKYFKTLWFDDDLDGKIMNANSRRPTVDGSAAGAASNTKHDLYNQNNGTDNANIEMIWEHLTDVDGDLTAGDLGKVDLVSDSDDEDTEDVNESTAPGNPDGNADNYPADLAGADDFRECSEADGGDDDDGTICDAVWTRDAEILFADGTFGCTTSRMVSITCTWDADGGMAQGRNALPSAADLDSDPINTDNNRANFLKCEAE